MSLYNKFDKQYLRKKLQEEKFQRSTVSFYKYSPIENPGDLRDDLYLKFDRLKIFGRIYLAKEGINAQVSVPEPHWNDFIRILYSYDAFNQLPLKKAVEDNGKSFYKLIIKVRQQIVADGLANGSFDTANVGKHLTANEFNKELVLGAIVVDMRNHYESEVGHFRGAICPDADTFKQELPMTAELLKDNKNEKILLYCTGGIRCEKASAYLKHRGFKDVNQLYGGIIEYAKQVKEENLENYFIGKNFVFDERLGERITNDIIAECHQCGKPSDNHTNCKNQDCHLLFIQCEGCSEKNNGCCSEECRHIFLLPDEIQRKMRKGKIKPEAHAVYKKGRLRPKLM